MTLEDLVIIKSFLHAQTLANKLARTGIPTRMHGGLIRYICEGIQPGDFLMAVLQNDLKEAFVRADDQNRELIHEYLSFLHNDAPAVCHGSVAKVTEWLRLGADPTGEGRF